MSAYRTMKLTLAWLLVSGPGTAQADTSLTGDTLFRLACQACHSLGPETSKRIGPRLDGLAGRRAGTATGYTYSDGLRQSGLVWNRDTLVAWIAGAERIIPGTLMAHHNNLESPEVLRLADYLTAPGRKP